MLKVPSKKEDYFLEIKIYTDPENYNHHYSRNYVYMDITDIWKELSNKYYKL
jgi:hypothetical protein